MTSAQQAFQILLSIGAGTGLLYIVRWFWWRVSAWCEVVAMAASLLSAAGIPLSHETGSLAAARLRSNHNPPGRLHDDLLAHRRVRRAADQPAKLVEFYKHVHPAGPGWEKVRQEANVTAAEVALHGDHMGMATLGWVSGCVVIWSSLFCIGNFLYGRLNLALILLATFIGSGLILLYVIRSLWSGATQREIAARIQPVPESVLKR